MKFAPRGARRNSAPRLETPTIPLSLSLPHDLDHPRPAGFPLKSNSFSVNESLSSQLVSFDTRRMIPEWKFKVGVKERRGENGDNNNLFIMAPWWLMPRLLDLSPAICDRGRRERRHSLVWTRKRMNSARDVEERSHNLNFRRRS